jgi:hypothetical protein
MAISRRVAQVLKGFTELNQTEKDEFVRNINDLLSVDPAKSRSIKEDVTRSNSITLGPAPSSCVCCGR